MTGPDYSAVPATMRDERRWLIWRMVERGGKSTKVPFRALDPGREASSTDPTTWASFEEACAASPRADGIGFALGDGWVGVDLDRVVKQDGGRAQIEPWADTIVRRLDSYTEQTPSGVGLHVICRGELPPGARRRGQLEMYDGARYFTVTGRCIAGTDAAERTAELASVHAEHLRRQDKPAAPPRDPQPVDVEDSALFDVIRRSRQGKDFDRLWNGDLDGHGGDHSAADLALVGMLRFWTGADAPRMDRLFRSSGLMRDKWDAARGEETYGARTLRMVLEAGGDVWTPPKPKLNGAKPDPIDADPGPEAPPWGGEAAEREGSAALRVASANGAEPDGTASRASFRKLDLVAFLDEDPPEPDYLLDGLLEYGELCWLSGRGKVGKSMVALYLAAAAVTGGQTFVGREVGSLDWVLYIDGENREATVRRRVHLAGLAAEVAAKVDYVSVRGVDLGTPPALAELARLVARPGRGLVILDSLVALHTADEDKAGEVRRFADKMRAVFESGGVTVLGLAHENRAGNLRGSLDWRNAADRVLELAKDGNGLRTLKVGDTRDGSDEEQPACFRFVPEVDQIGRTRLLLVHERGEAKSEETKAKRMSRQILLLLRGNPKLSQGQCAQELEIARDHGTFREAWKQAASELANERAGSLPGQS